MRERSAGSDDRRSPPPPSLMAAAAEEGCRGLWLYDDDCCTIPVIGAAAVEVERLLFCGLVMSVADASLFHRNRSARSVASEDGGGGVVACKKKGTESGSAFGNA